MPLPTSSYKSSNKKNLTTGVVVLVWLVLIAVVLGNFQNIYDWWKLRGYNEPADISQLASQDTMTAYASHIFKVDRPHVLDKADFAMHCPNNGGEQTIIL